MDEELSAAKQKLTELEAENGNLRANQQVLFDERAPGATVEDIAPDAIAVPETVAAAVQFAKDRCNNLVILDCALAAAEESPFQRPAEVAEALLDLNEVAEDWNQQKSTKGSGGDLRQQLIDRGWGKRCSMHISDMTRRRYKSDYTFAYQNETRLFEPHITLGSGDANSCASIHFLLDESTGMIVIAHVGRHLRNTKT